MEALVRWRDPERGLIPPEQFLPFAEQTGLITAIGAWTMREACVQLRTWIDEGRVRPDCRVSVNLSGAQLAQGGLVETVAAALEVSGIDASRLCLEIPEAALMSDVDRAARRLETVKELGIGLAIDRFGAGSSSLQALGRLPVDILKIDRSYMLGLGERPRAHALVAALIALAHAMELVPVAQGVQLESQAEIFHLKVILEAMAGTLPPDTGLLHSAERRGFRGHASSVDPHHAIFQGFRYSPPRPPDALDAVLAPGERRAGRAIRVFLCDDVTEMRDLVRVALEQEPDLEVVGEASDGDGAARGVSECRPDVILLDVSMPRVDGLEAIRRIRATSPATAILVLSGFEREAMADQAIGLGADAYLEKRASLDEIRDTLRGVVMARAAAR